MTTRSIPAKSSLNDRIRSFLDSLPLPPKAKRFLVAGLADLHSHTPTSLQEWSGAPDFSLVDQHGRVFHLSQALKRGPLVVSFVRGPSSPLCRLQLQAYNDILPDLRKLSTQLVAIAIQDAPCLKNMSDEFELDFPILCDADLDVVDAYGLRCVSNQELINIPDLDLDTPTAASIRPATFLIDHTRVIRGMHCDPDFSIRWEPEDLLEAAHDLAKQ